MYINFVQFSSSKPWNNSCKYVSVTQLQHNTSSPIHLKDDVKQNNNNNEHKWNTIEGGGGGGGYLRMGASVWLLQIERKISHHKPPPMDQYSSSMFTITIKDFLNNHYICWDGLISTKHDNPSQQQVEKHCRMQSWKSFTWEKDLWFRVLNIWKKMKP